MKYLKRFYESIWIDFNKDELESLITKYQGGELPVINFSMFIDNVYIRLYIEIIIEKLEYYEPIKTLLSKYLKRTDFEFHSGDLNQIIFVNSIGFKSDWVLEFFNKYLDISYKEVLKLKSKWDEYLEFTLDDKVVGYFYIIESGYTTGNLCLNKDYLESIIELIKKSNINGFNVDSYSSCRNILIKMFELTFDIDIHKLYVDQ